MAFTKLDGGFLPFSEPRLFHSSPVSRSGAASSMSCRKIRWTLVLFEACAALGVTFFLALSLWLAGPTLEVWLFPVASKLELLHVTSDPAGTRIQEARFTK